MSGAGSRPATRERSAGRGRPRWPWVLTAVYLVVGAVVTAVEYLSEVAKISRGTYTDTFSPYAFTEVLSFPASLVHPAWTAYPASFDASVFRRLVREAILPMAANVVVEAAALLAVCLLAAGLHRASTRRRRRPGGSSHLTDTDLARSR